MISCKKEDTVWETDWGFPLINDTLTLDNLVNDSTLFENPSGYYELDLTRTLLDIDVSEIVDIPDTTIVENFTIAFLNLTMNPGFNFVNSVEEHTFDIPNGAQLQKIILLEGYIDVTVKNPVGTSAIFDVVLPGVIKDGIPFVDQYIAPPGTMANPGIATNTLNLSGYEIDLSGVTGAEWNKFRSQVAVMTDPNGPTVVTTNQDTTKIEATFRDIKIGYARGYFGNQIISDTTEISMDALNTYYGGGMLDLPATSITLELENGVKAGGKATLHFMENENNQASTVSLNSSQIGSPTYINSATGNWGTLAPSYQNWVFDNSNSNIETYLENLGHKHRIGYTFELNPWGNVSGGWDEIFPNSRLVVRLNANMPINVGMDNLVLRDTFEVNLEQDPGSTNVKSGEFVLEADNAYPFRASAELILLDGNKNILHEVIGSSDLESGLYGPIEAESGLNVKKSTSRFVLSEAVLKDINRVKYMIVRVKLNSPDPVTGISEQQSIPVGAFIRVKVRSKLTTENHY